MGRRRPARAERERARVRGSIALWWETYEKPLESPPGFEASIDADVASSVARELSIPLVEEAADKVCSRFRGRGFFVEGVAAPYPGGPLTTVWASKDGLLEAMHVARVMAPGARIHADHDYSGDVGALLRKSGLLSE